MFFLGPNFLTSLICTLNLNKKAELPQRWPCNAHAIDRSLSSLSQFIYGCPENFRESL